MPLSTRMARHHVFDDPVVAVGGMAAVSAVAAAVA